MSANLARTIWKLAIGWPNCWLSAVPAAAAVGWRWWALMR